MDTQDKRDERYLHGYSMAPSIVRLHPQWTDPWFIMGWHDGKGDIEIRNEKVE